MEFEQIPDEKVLKEVFNQPSMGIAIFYPNFKYEKVNKAFCDLVSYSEEELKKKSFVDITHPAHILQDTEGVNKIISGENTFYKTEKRYIKRVVRLFGLKLFVPVLKMS
jgi:PAS domain S-box-containing protein